MSGRRGCKFFSDRLNYFIKPCVTGFWGQRPHRNAAADLSRHSRHPNRRLFDPIFWICLGVMRMCRNAVDLQNYFYHNPIVRQFDIDNSIPVPEGRVAQSGRRPSFPWGQLKIGDSFLVSEKKRMSAASSASQYKRSHPGWEYTSLRQENGAIRFWRIA